MLDDNGTGVVMPVSPMYGNGGFGNGFGGDWGWIILLLLFAGGGWGNGFNGGFGFDGIYPWMNQVDVTTSGFQNASTNSAIASLQNSVTSGFGDVQTALCGGFAGVNANIANGFAQSEIAENSRQMANMNQMFGIQSALQNCCCENRSNIADLKYTVATENCADRQVVSDGIKDILTATQAQTQAILNQLCSDKIEQKNDTINQLRSELLYARGQASQDVQTAAIQAGQRALANEVEQYVAPKAMPAYIVQNPNCCTNTCGCAI